MLIYGAGGHASVILSMIEAMGGEVTAIFDDDRKLTTFHEHPVFNGYSEDIYPEKPLIIAIGNNQIRRKLARQISHDFANIIHPTAHLERRVILGKGNVCMPKTIVQCGVRLGDHVILNSGVIVEHDCQLGDFVHIAPGSILCGNVNVGENAFVGAGSVILPNIRISKNCIIGAGSVVTQDVPDNQTVAGSPARLIYTHYK